MKKVKYIGPMRRVKIFKIGEFEKGQIREMDDQKALLLLREPGFVEVKEPVKEIKPKGGKE